ncbi:glycosyltransferase [Hydrogenophaga sp. UC242_50]|uniref:glycosyltransferase n=1 Tax=Hydrogenophaga sp. UC242_50 TaxID=3350169 RepID=UPI0036D3AF9D
MWKLPARRVTFIPNGVDIPAAARAVSVEEGRPVRIGTVAGLRPEKNIARLIRAFANVRARRSARLIVVGDGAQRGELEALAQQLGVAADVEFTGYLKDPSARLTDFDLFALSSDTEQLPIALLEAMAVGMPVVRSARGRRGRHPLGRVARQPLRAAGRPVRRHPRARPGPAAPVAGVGPGRPREGAGLVRQGPHDRPMEAGVRWPTSPILCGGLRPLDP